MNDCCLSPKDKITQAALCLIYECYKIFFKLEIRILLWGGLKIVFLCMMWGIKFPDSYFLVLSVHLHICCCCPRHQIFHLTSLMVWEVDQTILFFFFLLFSGLFSHYVSFCSDVFQFFWIHLCPYVVCFGVIWVWGC